MSRSVCLWSLFLAAILVTTASASGLTPQDAARPAAPTAAPAGVGLRDAARRFAEAYAAGDPVILHASWRGDRAFERALTLAPRAALAPTRGGVRQGGQTGLSVLHGAGSIL